MNTTNVDIRGREETISADAGDVSQNVTFLIGNETYGVAVERVKEIIGITDITRIPDMPDFVRGVINLRGVVVPVVELRKKFFMQDRDYDSATVIIIVEVDDKYVGMIVDAVSDVLNIPSSTIQNIPDLSRSVESEFISGIGQVDGKMIILLDVDSILSKEELKMIDEERVRSAGV